MLIILDNEHNAMGGDKTMGHEAQGSFSDYFSLGELPRSIEDVCMQLEKEGWQVATLMSDRGLRYWCPCSRRHQIWVDSKKALSQEILDIYLDRTCLTFR
jgi:hypothetical protein